MAKNSYVSANLSSTYDTFAGWLDKTNRLIYDMGTTVLTANASASPDITTGNAFVNGYFGANIVYVTSSLQGGTANTAANLAIASSLTVAGQTWMSSNANVTGSANVSVNVNTVGILANNGTFNNNLIVSNTATLNVATVVTANITTINAVSIGANSANVTNLYAPNTIVTTLAIGTGGANISANATTITFTGTSNINATAYSGTAANSTLFAGQSLSTVQGWISGNSTTAYTNATSYADTKAATAYSNAVSYADTKAGAAYTNAVNYAGNAVSNGTWVAANATFATNAAALGGIVANTASATDGYVLTYDAATSRVAFKNPNTIISALSANTLAANTQLQAGSNGTTYVANVYGNSTVTTATFRANTITLTVDSGSIQLNSAAIVTSTFYAGNTAANVNIATGTVTLQSNSTTSATINSTSYSGAANSATYLGGSTLGTIQGQITGNAATAYSNAVANAAALYQTTAGLSANVATLTANAATYLGNSATTGANVASWISGNSATAYSNATVFAANASNINTGTLAEARLPATTVNTSGTFVLSGVITFAANAAYGNSTVNAVTFSNSSGVYFTGTAYTANNATNLGGVAASGYQTASGLSANVLTLAANAATYLGNSSGTLSTISSWIGGNSATTYSNATSYADTKAATAYANATAFSSNASNLSTGTVPTARLGGGTANSTTVLYGNNVWAIVPTPNLASPGPIGATTANTGQFSSLGVGTAASATTGEIRAVDNITSYYSSDSRFKENVHPISDALTKVDFIGGKTFDWSDAYIEAHGGEDGYFIQKSDFGVIAQDVESVFPLAVRTRSDGTLAVDYEKLVALAFQAIKELKSELDEIKAKL